MLIDQDPLGQVKFVRLFKVTVLSLHVIMMKPEIKDVRGWQFLTTEAAETLYMVCLPSD